MSTITGSCSTSQAQLLFERGLQDTQNQRLQEAEQRTDNTIQALGSGQGNRISETLSGQILVSEPNKGENIDLYA